MLWMMMTTMTAFLTIVSVTPNTAQIYFYFSLEDDDDDGDGIPDQGKDSLHFPRIVNWLSIWVFLLNLKQKSTE